MCAKSKYIKKAYTTLGYTITISVNYVVDEYIYSQKMNPKILQWSLALILLTAFIIMTGISLKTLFKKEVGTYQRIEYGSFLPDFTICPYQYDKNMSNISTYQNIDIGGNHTASDIKTLLPSIKQMITIISIVNLSYNQQKSKYPGANIWEDGKMFDGIEEKNFWQEFFIIGPTNFNQNFGVFRCATLKWPTEMNKNFGSNSFVSEI